MFKATSTQSLNPSTYHVHDRRPAKGELLGHLNLRYPNPDEYGVFHHFPGVTPQTSRSYNIRS